MKKIIALIIALLTLTLAFTGCFGGGDGGESKGDTYVEVTANKTNISIGEKIIFTVKLESIEKVKSFGFEIKYDSDCFELVDSAVLISADISDFSDNIAVLAFSEAKYLNQNVISFTLKAKQACLEEIISVTPSLKDANDNNISIDNNYSVTVNVE